VSDLAYWTNCYYTFELILRQACGKQDIINPFQTWKDSLVDLLQHAAHRVGNTATSLDGLISHQTRAKLQTRQGNFSSSPILCFCLSEISALWNWVFCHFSNVSGRNYVVADVKVVWYMSVFWKLPLWPKIEPHEHAGVFKLWQG